MIKRINTLKHTGRFTELRCDSGDDGKFAKLNVVYASNASGKSTLCDVLRAMTSGEPAYVLGRKRLDATAEPEIVIALTGSNPGQTVRFQNGSWQNASASPKIHVYDERFVADNVLIGHHISVDHRRNLYGLVIGAQGIVLKQRVDNAAQDLTESNTAVNEARSKLERLLPDGQTIEAFRPLPGVNDIDQQIAKAARELEDATQTKSKVDAIRQRPSLSSVPVPAVPAGLSEVLAATLDGAALAAEQKIRKHLDAHAPGLSIEWVGQGHRGQTGTKCPHCGQDMEGLDILRTYLAYFSGELQAQEQRRAATETDADRVFGISARSRVRETLTAHETERSWWQDAAGFRFELPTLRDQTSIEDALGAAHEAIKEALARKQANPSTPVGLPEAEQQSLGGWQEIASELNAYNDALPRLNDTLAQKKTDAGNVDLVPLNERLDALKASKRRHQHEVIDAFTAYDAAVAEQQQAQRAKQTANETLRNDANQILADYGTKINDLLNLFSVDFRIVSEGVNFRGGSASGQLAIELHGNQISCKPEDAANPARPSLANTLSGGDRSAFALAFFLATLEQAPDLGDSIVVFDDPFHSQDRSRQSRTVERIHRIARAAKQCFVFSHDLEFARAVVASQHINAKTFVLDPLADRTTLEAKPLPMLPSRAYEQKYALLTDYIARPADFADQLKMVAGTLRIILEEYLQLKFPQRWEEGRDWLGTMIGKIRKATEDDSLVSCQTLVQDLTDVNEYSQRFHHRTTGAAADIPDARELINYARQTLSIIHK